MILSILFWLLFFWTRSSCSFFRFVFLGGSLWWLKGKVRGFWFEWIWLSRRFVKSLNVRAFWSWVLVTLGLSLVRTTLILGSVGITMRGRLRITLVIGGRRVRIRSAWVRMRIFTVVFSWSARKAFFGGVVLRLSRCWIIRWWRIVGWTGVGWRERVSCRIFLSILLIFRFRWICFRRGAGWGIAIWCRRRGVWAIWRSVCTRFWGCFVWLFWFFWLIVLFSFLSIGISRCR